MASALTMTVALYGVMVTAILLLRRRFRQKLA
jgi:hypothetical protein